MHEIHASHWSIKCFFSPKEIVFSEDIAWRTLNDWDLELSVKARKENVFSRGYFIFVTDLETDFQMYLGKRSNCRISAENWGFSSVWLCRNGANESRGKAEEKFEDLPRKDIDKIEESNEEEKDEDRKEPEFKSPKEKECWVLYQKMVEKGVTVSFDTVLRWAAATSDKITELTFGLKITNSYYRSLFFQRNADADRVSSSKKSIALQLLTW